MRTLAERYVPCYNTGGDGTGGSIGTGENTAQMGPNAGYSGFGGYGGYTGAPGFASEAGAATGGGDYGGGPSGQGGTATGLAGLDASQAYAMSYPGLSPSAIGPLGGPGVAPGGEDEGPDETTPPPPPPPQDEGLPGIAATGSWGAGGGGWGQGGGGGPGSQGGGPSGGAAAGPSGVGGGQTGGTGGGQGGGQGGGFGGGSGQGTGGAGGEQPFAIQMPVYDPNTDIGRLLQGMPRDRISPDVINRDPNFLNFLFRQQGVPLTGQGGELGREDEPMVPNRVTTVPVLPRSTIDRTPPAFPNQAARDAFMREALGRIGVPGVDRSVEAFPGRGARGAFLTESLARPAAEGVTRGAAQLAESGRSPRGLAMTERSDPVPMLTPTQREAREELQRHPNRMTDEEIRQAHGEPAGGRFGIATPTQQTTPFQTTNVSGQQRDPEIYLGFDPSSATNPVQFIGSYYRGLQEAGLPSNAAYENAMRLQSAFQGLGIPANADPTSAGNEFRIQYGMSPEEYADNILTDPGGIGSLAQQNAVRGQLQLGEYTPGFGTTGLGPDMYVEGSTPGSRGTRTGVVSYDLNQPGAGAQSYQDFVQGFQNPQEGQGAQFYNDQYGTMVGGPMDFSSMIDLGFDRSGNPVGGTYMGLEEGAPQDIGGAGPSRAIRLEGGNAFMDLNSGDYSRQLTPREMARLGITL